MNTQTATQTKEQKAENIERTLPGFTGTMEYHRASSLYRNVFMTDGAFYLAESAGAYWLMDVITSHQHKTAVRRNPFQVWQMTVKNGQARVWCEDGNGNKLSAQIIPFTDFPLSYIKLYWDFQNNMAVIMLPSEY